MQYSFRALGICCLLSCSAGADQDMVRVSTVAINGMPKDIVAKGAAWNFGAGSLWTHKGWQYAAFWDDARQVSVARRKLPRGGWSVASLPGYQRTETGDRGKGGAISQGFGDGHEKVAMGISPDGVIHLSFDHHLSTLRYRTSKHPVADDPERHDWSADLFGEVQDHLGGPQLVSVTYPSFHTDGSRFLLYMRLGGGSGSANSHLFTYQDGGWVVNSEEGSKLIDREWSGGDGTVNAYPFGLILHEGRCHLAWCWRDTPEANTCHDLCYAYSDDFGRTWRNNDGEVIGILGKKFISADSPGVSVWPVPAGKRYINGGSAMVDDAGGVHVLVRGEDGRPAYFHRIPQTGKWHREQADVRGSFVPFQGKPGFMLSGGALYRKASSDMATWEKVASAPENLFEDCKPGRDVHRVSEDGWVSVIGQQGRKVSVVDYRLVAGE